MPRRKDPLAKELQFAENEDEAIRPRPTLVGNNISSRSYANVNGPLRCAEGNAPDANNQSDSSAETDSFQIFVFIFLFLLVFILLLLWLNNFVDTLYTLAQSVACGLLCAGLSWIITFYDSLEPGRYPPTPMSPSKARQKSGHTFHSSYIMVIMNGVAAFLVSLWYFLS